MMMMMTMMIMIVIITIRAMIIIVVIAAEAQPLQRRSVRGGSALAESSRRNVSERITIGERREVKARRSRACLHRGVVAAYLFVVPVPRYLHCIALPTHLRRDVDTQQELCSVRLLQAGKDVLC